MDDALGERGRTHTGKTVPVDDTIKYEARFSDAQERQNTFTPENGWNILKPTSQQLVDAGFYYTGVEDKVRCYSCKIAVFDWKKDDVPLEEHKKEVFEKRRSEMGEYGEYITTCEFLTSINEMPPDED